jgi:hypothetical protein
MIANMPKASRGMGRDDLGSELGLRQMLKRCTLSAIANLRTDVPQDGQRLRFLRYRHIVCRVCFSNVTRVAMYPVPSPNGFRPKRFRRFVSSALPLWLRSVLIVRRKPFGVLAPPTTLAQTKVSTRTSIFSEESSRLPPVPPAVVGSTPCLLRHRTFANRHVRYALAPFLSLALSNALQNWLSYGSLTG